MKLTTCPYLGLLHQSNLRPLLSHNIFSIDQILQMRKLWAAQVRSNDNGSLGLICWPGLVKNKRNEKAAKFSVPLPKVRGIAEEEMFKVVKTGKKTAKKGMSDHPFETPFRPCECLSICSQMPTHNCIEKQPCLRGWVAEQAEKYNIEQFLGWKRMITKPTFVGPDFTRRPVKYERFIRPMGLRYKKANVTVSSSFYLNQFILIV